MDRSTVSRRIQRNPGFFKADFPEWVDLNWGIFSEFCIRTHRQISAGRLKYSARTIIEVMVHDSFLSDAHTEYKIGNDRAPDMARAFVLAYPEHVDFWEYRRPDWREFKAHVSRYPAHRAAQFNLQGCTTGRFSSATAHQSNKPLSEREVTHQHN